MQTKLTGLVLGLFSAAQRGAARMRVIGLGAAVLGVLTSCSDSEQDADPALLSSQGLYSDIGARKVVANAIEYVPDYVLWSDAVQKRRWLVLPSDTRIDTSDMEHWQFRVGAKLFKEFSLYGKLLETRMIERTGETRSALTP